MPSIDEAISVLNEIVRLDPTVLTELFSYRVPCNKALADHETVQVGAREGYWPDWLQRPYEVGLLGIINGIFGIDERGWGHIYAMIEEHDGEERVVGFGRRKD